jgi:hypothetical protein
VNTNVEVDHVISALDRSKAQVPKDWDYLSQDLNVMYQFFELDYNSKPLSDHLGIGKELFPAAEQLEDDEIKTIVEKILETWAAYNYIADLPRGLPIRIAYKALLSVWDETVTCCPIGNYHFDFYEMELDRFVDSSYKKISCSDTELSF